ncbi:MAG: hypothetical protein UX49_C0009G0031 [Candidatus Wolfebacteria bacterium GW2011_GWC2_46_275]|nr:MAG: phage-related replication protein [Candidatus Wolfebacteria bacterium GW2011_GWB1_47_1]KKU36786.1 MAG: hypothetical protein UX49_C0009G0031 [Candidatus Wolfebacteria bacterium GW2011_GWC2_46_275]KKU42326.1 MAG: hypothetical protein UX58_C0002G0040 [Candidatus Wolfebacteria bacterium GW2011_GWB2_46_69]KKU58913.1 MAG: hypothetical protein UX83_C0010G0035 [Candidatus Wolfebacteria bacterium GW2011_GWE2_47_12]KKU66123.1 MAG: hypothetical protein UX90_C0001G0182 [Candidatus Wolfebacteria bac
MTFANLAAHMQEGVDFRITAQKKNESILIMAIHGGNIEPFTTEIATAIAGNEYGLYLFEGVRAHNNKELHIGSMYFDEPRAQDMALGAETIVSVHGHRNTEHEFVMIGGLNRGLAERIARNIGDIDIEVRPFEEIFHPGDARNICNRGLLGGGVEIEISRKLRDALREDAGLYRLFTNAIRRAIAR